MTTLYWFNNLIQVHWDESGLEKLDYSVYMRNKMYDSLTTAQIDYVINTHRLFN